VSTQDGAQIDPAWRQAQVRHDPAFRRAAAPEARARLIAPPLLDLEFATSLALFASMLFVNQLGSLGGLFVVAITAAYMLLHITRLYDILLPRAFILLIPAVIILSTLWSETRSETLKYGIEFAFTAAAGLMLSASRRPMSVLFGMFLAFGIYIVVSLAFGQSVFVVAKVPG